ncbi:MAG: gas vesicle protein GvpJ [Actinomycetes bacterium]
MELEPVNDTSGSLADVVDAILDKGLVINADILISLAGVELLGIKVRAALASFETAARYGLEFPAGTDLTVPAWSEAAIARVACPGCDERFVGRDELLEQGCPACGWQSARALAALADTPYAPPAM